MGSSCLFIIPQIYPAALAEESFYFQQKENIVNNGEENCHRKHRLAQKNLW
jgi:hypothetical protein